MKKLLTYLITISCFIAFISATPGFCGKHRNLLDINSSVVTHEDTTLLQNVPGDDFNPLTIFTFRYF